MAQGLSEKISTVIGEFKRGKLKSGSGATVKKRSQALAIAFDTARREGLKVPPKKA